MATWVQRTGPDGRSVFVPKQGRKSRVHHVVPDIEDYASPVDGRRVSGRKQRREDLKRNHCVEYDPGMREKARSVSENNEREAEKKIIERLRWINA